jgi:hypothetical protein
MPEGQDTPLVWNGVVAALAKVMCRNEREKAHTYAEGASSEGEAATAEEAVRFVRNQVEAEGHPPGSLPLR